MLLSYLVGLIYVSFVWPRMLCRPERYALLLAVLIAHALAACYAKPLSLYPVVLSMPEPEAPSVVHVNKLCNTSQSLLFAQLTHAEGAKMGWCPSNQNRAQER